LVYTFAAEGVGVKVCAEDLEGRVKFTFDTALAEGYRIDLNGFFIDLGGDGGTIRSIGAKSNNMNGGNNDGRDAAVVLGHVGGNEADFVDGDAFIACISVAYLAGADAGLRATS